MVERPHDGDEPPERTEGSSPLRQEGLYRTIFGSSPVAMLLADDQRRYVEANEAACRLLGLSRGALLSRRIDDFMLVGDGEALELVWQAFRRAGEQSAEIELVRGDGTPRLVSFSARANILPGLHLSILEDVTEQRAYERRIARERDQLHEAVHRRRERLVRMQAVTASLAAARTLHDVAQVIVNEGCSAFDAQRGVVALVAEGDTEMQIVALRGARDESARVGQRFSLSAPTPMVTAIRTLTPQIYESPAALEAAFPELFRSFWAQYSAIVALPLAADGYALGALALTYAAARTFSDDDCTELSAFARLCAQAIERAQLFDLAQAERRHAEEANRVKDEFLAVVSHELRTPLHAMLGWATLARSGRLSKEAQARALETVERNARTQAKLVEDLLDVTRITSGKMQLHIEPVDIVRVVEAALDVVRPAAEAKGVRLEPRLSAPGRPLRGDPDRLQQVVWNLLSNAVKFSERGGRVEVAVDETEAALVIEVRDSGRGIEPSFLPHLYERFRQADAGRRGGSGGLGLGLAIVRHLVELHGGSIEAASDGLEQGARFAVTLPFMAEASPGATASVQPVAAELGAPASLAGMRVLVVDDERESRDLLASVLDSCGVLVDVASSAEEGFALLTRAPPDVILSDVRMPGQDGYAFIERVRRLPADQGGATPAVALTAHARSEDRTRALLSGFDMHLSKPVAPAELLGVVANVAGRPSVHRLEP